MNEVKLAATLLTAGFAIELRPDTPDIIAEIDGRHVGIELTAGQRTLRYSSLLTAVAYAWNQPGRLILLCADETVHYLTTERDGLVSMLPSIHYSTLTPHSPTPGDWSDGTYFVDDEAFLPDEREVPVAHIVDPGKLRVFLGPAPEPVVVVQSGARVGVTDPWPLIAESAKYKAAKMGAVTTGVIAYEAGMLHHSAHMWADVVARGVAQTPLRLPQNIGGVSCYWLDALKNSPAKSMFIRNLDFAGDWRPLNRLIDILSPPAPEPPPQEDGAAIGVGQSLSTPVGAPSAQPRFKAKPL